VKQLVPSLALACLLLTGHSPAVLDDDVPPPDTKCELILFDFGDANDKEVRDAAIARFYTHYPNIKVTDHFTPVSSWADYIEKLMAEVAAGNAPDLIHLATEGAQLAISKNLLIPVNSYASSDAAAKNVLTDIDPALLKRFTVEGKLYLVPVAWNSMLVHCVPFLPDPFLCGTGPSPCQLQCN
jgi:multiple sugar transport system substrate-binding protein